MASITVFADRAVRGDLPHVCVRTGQSSEIWVQVREAVGGLGAAAWILVLLGPLGWIALAILSTVGTGREMLTVRLPYSHEAWDRLIRRRRIRFAGGLWALGVLGAIAVGVVSAHFWSLAAAGAGLLVATAAQVMLSFDEVGVSLDATRRWVTLMGVHQAFADAAIASGADFVSNR